MGISYIKYITELRINKAIELLSKNENTTDIHIQCGYYNPQTFSTAFKKITGLTVKGFLNMHKDDK